MSCKEEDDSRLTPAEDNDAAERKIDRKECLLLIEDQYQRLCRRCRALHGGIKQYKLIASIHNNRRGKAYS